MTHVVHHLDADGTSVWDTADGLDAALERIEALQHSGTTGLKVYGEVPIRIETIYRVSVAGGSAADGETAEDAAAPEPPASGPAAAEEPVEPVEDEETVTDGTVVATAVVDTEAEPAQGVAEGGAVAADEPSEPPATIDTADEDAILAAVGAVEEAPGDAADTADEPSEPSLAEEPAESETDVEAAAVEAPPGSALLGPPSSSNEQVPVEVGAAESNGAGNRGIFGRG